MFFFTFHDQCRQLYTVDSVSKKLFLLSIMECEPKKFQFAPGSGPKANFRPANTHSYFRKVHIKPHKQDLFRERFMNFQYGFGTGSKMLAISYGKFIPLPKPSNEQPMDHWLDPIYEKYDKKPDPWWWHDTRVVVPRIEFPSKELTDVDLFFDSSSDEKSNSCGKPNSIQRHHDFLTFWHIFCKWWYLKDGEFYICKICKKRHKIIHTYYQS